MGERPAGKIGPVPVVDVLHPRLRPVASGHRSQRRLRAVRPVESPFVSPRPYLLAAREIELFFKAAATLRSQSPWRWQAVAFFTLMHSSGLRTGEARALQAGQVNLDDGHIDIVWSKGNRSRRLPLTGQVAEVLGACDRTSRAHFPSRRMFFVFAAGNQVTPAAAGRALARIWDHAG